MRAERDKGRGRKAPLAQRLPSLSPPVTTSWPCPCDVSVCVLLTAEPGGQVGPLGKGRPVLMLCALDVPRGACTCLTLRSDFFI